MIAEWDKPFLLTSPLGTLKFNEPQGSGPNADDLYIMDEEKCNSTIMQLRTTHDDVPQNDGTLLHRIFKSGYSMNVECQLHLGDIGADAEPACGADRVRMLDNLMMHLNALVDPAPLDTETGLCRMQWELSGVSEDRMLNAVKLTGWPHPTVDVPIMSVQFELQSPFPYAMDVDEQVLAIGASTFMTNIGTAPFYPVFKVWGPFSSFSIQNITSSFEEFGYDAAFPGASAVAGGNYIEINTFRNTMFLNGSGANMMAGLDVAVSEFWKVLVGAQELSFTADNAGALCEMLWQPAWA